LTYHEEFKRIEPIEPPSPPYDISDYSLPEQAGIILWLFREAVSILVAKCDGQSMEALEKRIADFCTFMIEHHFNPNQQQHHDSIAEEMLKEVDDIDELIDN
tara:strand:+ start:453 stop:758 length:306 start_codon:yes stop_codon:yes gene_type:complete